MNICIYKTKLTKLINGLNNLRLCVLLFSYKFLFRNQVWHIHDIWIEEWESWSFRCSHVNASRMQIIIALWIKRPILHVMRKMNETKERKRKRIQYYTRSINQRSRSKWNFIPTIVFSDLIDHIFLRVNISFASWSRAVPLTCQPACAVMS